MIQHENIVYTRRAFSIVELIFIIVLLGILASIGGNLLPDNRLLNDTNFITMKIKEKQRYALGNAQGDFGDIPWNNFSQESCIEFKKASLENESSDSQKKYILASGIEIISSDRNETLCFDEYGRPYSSGALLVSSKDVNLTYNGEIATISVMPMSGYVMIK